MNHEAEIAVLERALNSGQRSVQFNGRKVEYQDMDAIRTRLKELKQEASGATTYRGVVQHVRAGRGW